jgi:hypothetical protein
MGFARKNVHSGFRPDGRLAAVPRSTPSPAVHPRRMSRPAGRPRYGLAEGWPESHRAYCLWFGGGTIPQGGQATISSPSTTKRSPLMSDRQTSTALRMRDFANDN